MSCESEAAAVDGTETTTSSSAPTTRGPLTVEYCPYCTMPPEYCEFSACFADKCKPWLEKHHPELLTGGDLSSAVGSLILSDQKEEKKNSISASADDKKSSKKQQPTKKKAQDDDNDDDNDDDDEDDDEDDDDNDEPTSKPKGSAAAAIRSKAPGSGLGVFIRKEERTKRKFTTTVKGMDSFGCDLKKAAKSFSKKFACSASVVKVTEGGQEIQIQGDVQMELPDFILQEFKEIDKSSLYFLDKANKKTRCF